MKQENTKKPRTLINLIGAPCILFIIYQGGILFNCFIYIVILLSIKELSELMNYKDYSINTIFIYSIILLLFLSHYYIYDIQWYVGLYIFFIICIWEFFRFKKTPLKNIVLTIFGLFWIVFFLDKIIFIRSIQGGFQLTLCMFLSVWSCDSAAFYFGSKFGKKKILPKISPNKTWIGTIAGYISSVLIVYIFLKFGFLSNVNYDFIFIDIIIMGTIFGGVGQMGDFFESMIKRKIGVNDSGTILQGHGGVLDRFDSLFFVIPTFYLYILFSIINF